MRPLWFHITTADPGASSFISARNTKIMCDSSQLQRSMLICQSQRWLLINQRELGFPKGGHRAFLPSLTNLSNIHGWITNYVKRSKQLIFFAQLVQRSSKDLGIVLDFAMFLGSMLSQYMALCVSQ